MSCSPGSREITPWSTRHHRPDLSTQVTAIQANPSQSETIAYEATTQTQVDALARSIRRSRPGSPSARHDLAPRSQIVLDLSGGNYPGEAIAVPEGYTLVINGGALDGASRR